MEGEIQANNQLDLNPPLRQRKYIYGDRPSFIPFFLNAKKKLVVKLLRYAV